MPAGVPAKALRPRAAQELARNPAMLVKISF